MDMVAIEAMAVMVVVTVAGLEDTICVVPTAPTIHCPGVAAWHGPLIPAAEGPGECQLWGRHHHPLHRLLDLVDVFDMRLIDIDLLV